MAEKGDTGLGPEMIKVAQYIIDTSFFEELKALSLGVGKEYVALDLVVRRIIERDFLGMAFSPYLMNLDRYTILAPLKEVPKSDEEFWKIISTLPYNVWLRYAGIPSLPSKTLILTYTIPARGPIERIVSLLEKHPAIDKKKEIEAHRYRYTFYTKPHNFSNYFDKGSMKSFTEAKSTILKEIEEEEPINHVEFYRKRSDPMDIIDVIIMSYLEAKYLVTPIWTYRKIGALKLHVRTLKKHFKRHIRDKYYLGVYLKRPPTPGIINTVFITIISGREALKLAYKLSRTPYASAFCDRENKNRCLTQFFCREEDIPTILGILSSYKIDIENYIFIFHRSSKPTFHDKRTISFAAYDEKAKRWFGLDEAVEKSSIVASDVISKYFKVERIPREMIPIWLRKDSSEDKEQDS